MIRQEAADKRACRETRMDADLVVVGGGMAGTCCAVTAAREGLKVVLIQDRPVLGGNASSEVRLWVLGATAHMSNNNRWAREGGVIDELLVENLWRNPEGNALIFDTILLETVRNEPNLELLLNTAVFEASKSAGDTISGVRAFCSQNSTAYDVRAPLFCDASGDGVLAFMAGAAFRMGAEATAEFGELFAPSKEYGELLGHSIYFYSKDVGQPVRFVPPAYALKDITTVPRYKAFNSRTHGCKLWWIEWGGRLDTVHDTEKIKWELWKVVYGVWDHIKNSGQFPDAANLTLEWVGLIPGKRESRRFEGEAMLIQQDLIEQRHHDDAVSFGGWAIDLHPADGIYSEKPGCTQWHSKGVYQIPYRCLYSRDITNLFLAGRIISVSHVAFGSTRVMATCAHAAQAAGMAAVLCRRESLRPRELVEAPRMRRLQTMLARSGQYMPRIEVSDPENLAATATVRASSTLVLERLAAGAAAVPLDTARAMLVPVQAGRMPAVSLGLQAIEPTEVEVQLRTSSRLGNYTPDVLLETIKVKVGSAAAVSRYQRPPMEVVPAIWSGPVGGCPFSAAEDVHTRPAEEAWPKVAFRSRLDQDQYVLICLMPNPRVGVLLSDLRITGVLALVPRSGHGSKTGQKPPPDIGVESFDLWAPQRRPGGQNFAMIFDPRLGGFEAKNVLGGPDRPTVRPNAWVAALDDPKPTLSLVWNSAPTISRIELAFDTDLDHPLESVLMGHPERVVPFCVKHYRLLDGRGRVLHEARENHQTRNVIRPPQPLRTDRLQLEVLETWGAPAAVFSVRCYENM